MKSSRLDPIAKLKASDIWTPAERERIERADSAALEKALGAGANVWELENFSETLLAAGQIPPALFVRGDTACLHAPTVAIVGTRRASTYGKAVAQKFAERLASVGVTVISGGAFGIDVAAHQGALSAGGKTVAVLASGIDVVYPSPHRGVFDQIAAQGCLVSQFACGVKPEKYRFLQRNELVAALADATLVIEAPEASGALRTAGAAAGINRDVFVVPGNISNLNFRGSHGLIRDGAMLVDHPDQILESMGIEAPPEPEPSLSQLTPTQQRLLEQLGDEPLPVEALVEKTGLDAADLLGELTMMEIEGLILRDGIGYARRP